MECPTLIDLTIDTLDDNILLKIIQKYGGVVEYEEINPVIIEDYEYLDDTINNFNESYIFSFNNIILVITNILISDRLFTRQISPTYKSETNFNEHEIKSVAFMDLLYIMKFLTKNKIKISDLKNKCVYLSTTRFITLCMKLSIIYCDQESRMINFIINEYVKIYDGIDDIIQIIIEYDRVDSLKVLIDSFIEKEIDCKKFIIDNATNLALISINSNSMLSYLYITLIASDNINYKYLLNSKLKILPKKYTYIIDINKNVEIVRDRFISNYDINYIDTIISSENIL